MQHNTTPRPLRRNKFLLLSFILLVVFSTAIPIFQVAMRVYYKKNVYIYFYQPKSDNFCQVVRTLDVSEMQNQQQLLLEEVVSQALLMPSEDQLENNNNDGLFLRSALVDKNLAILSFSSEYYVMDRQEVWQTTTAIALAISANFENIKEILWLVEGEDVVTIDDDARTLVPLKLESVFAQPIAEKAVILHKNILNTEKALLPRERMQIEVGKWADQSPINIRDCRLR